MATTTDQEEMEPSSGTTNSPEEVTTATVVDSAEALSVRRRAAAERRRRILEQSDDRIHVVIGGTPTTITNDSETETATENMVDINPDESNKNDEDDEKKQQQQQEEEIPSNKGRSGSTRLQQMRRRRFLNKQRSAEEASPNDAAGCETTEEATSVTVVDPQQEQPVEEEQPLNMVKEPSSEVEGPKYVGVARMRRKIVAKQRQQKQNDTEKNQQLGVDPMLLILPKALRQLPIVLELFTILLLCVAGMGMGWHTWLNNSDCFQSGIHAADKISFKTIPFFPAKFNVTAAASPRELVASSFEHTLSTGGAVINNYVDDDEFASTTKQPKKPSRIEGVEDEEDDDEDFHFDYDKIYAKKKLDGGNPFDLIDLIFSKILSTVRSIISTIFFLKWFRTCPPTFLVVAVLGRHSCRMLGRGAYPEDMEESEEGGSNNYDVLKVVKKFITKSFPTLAKFYQFYTEARTDMYVVLFGWFLGLVVPHLWNSAAIVSTISQGEL